MVLSFIKNTSMELTMHLLPYIQNRMTGLLFSRKEVSILYTFLDRLDDKAVELMLVLLDNFEELV